MVSSLLVGFIFIIFYQVFETEYVNIYAVGQTYVSHTYIPLHQHNSTWHHRRHHLPPPPPLTPPYRYNIKYYGHTVYYTPLQ